jgi:Domain of unknown function (DUF1992)
MLEHHTMTDRKPPGVGFGTWVEHKIREAAERGAFDNLPGAGKPIPDLDKPHDELWWIKRKLRDEGLAWLPPTIALRKEAEAALATAARPARRPRCGRSRPGSTPRSPRATARRPPAPR